MRIVSPTDIPMESPSVAALSDFGTESLIPYCLDFGQDSIILAAGLDPRSASSAPFHYLYLREHTREFLRVPAETLTSVPSLGLARLALVFSPGRCGSTLLNALLGEMGAVSISEPDFYTQAACHFALRRSRGLPYAERTVQTLGTAGRMLLAPLAVERTAAITLKLRSEANFSPAEILASFPAKPKAIFLTRGFNSWCQSRMRAFPDSLEENFAVYVAALRALQWLRTNAECLCLAYEVLGTRPVETCELLSRFLELCMPSEQQLLAVISKDSQADTPLARETIAHPLPGSTLQNIEKLWQSRAPRGLLRDLGLDYLI